MAEPERKNPSTGSLARNKTLAGSGGPPHDTGMEERVTRLEVSFEQLRSELGEMRHDQRDMRADIRDLRGDIKDLIKTVGEIRVELSRKPTTAQLWGIIASISGIALTVVILIVGGMSVGLQYLSQ